ncbi:MAG TPA: serine protease [Candidatus Elarobacter sp.]|nr:serine protease [Candidatus Elarobacter sp.]
MLAITLFGAVLLAPAASAQSTPDVFRRFSDRVVKIQVFATRSSAKTTLGSGFYVDGDGTVVTNYHVVSKLINEPGKYRAELTDARDASTPVTVVAIDVVNDLAVLSSPNHPAAWLPLDTTEIRRGERLYSLGHPQDLGLSIVEGTYNGLLEHTLYPKIHFTGALNPGMSGGPTITSDGHVTGVNVSTEGNEISFLVPVARARALVERAHAPGFHVAGGFLADAARQILAYQDAYLRDMFRPSSPSVRLGSFRLPTRPAPFFRCWGDTYQKSDSQYTVLTHQCSTDDELFISDEQESGVAEIDHRMVTTTALGTAQFFSLYAGRFVHDELGFGGDEQYVTRFKCQTQSVAHETTKMRVVFCARAYRKLPGLYDAVVRAATLGAANTGVVTTLKLSGVSFSNARELARRYVGSVSWIH